MQTDPLQVQERSGNTVTGMENRVKSSQHRTIIIIKFILYYKEVTTLHFKILMLLKTEIESNA